MAARRLAPIAILVAASLLAACSAGDEDAPSAADEARAATLLAEYQQFRRDGQWELAEARADALRKSLAETEAASRLGATLAETRQRAEAMREERRLAALWEYQQVQAGKGVQRTAALYSRVEVDPESESQPIPDARLVLRRHPEWGRSAYLLLEQSQLQCGPPCRLSIRFDDGKPESYAGDPADSGSGPALFIEDDARFQSAMQKSSRVRIQLPQSGALVPVFEFEVGGFDPVPLGDY